MNHGNYWIAHDNSLMIFNFFSSFKFNTAPPSTYNFVKYFKSKNTFRTVQCTLKKYNLDCINKILKDCIFDKKMYSKLPLPNKSTVF